MTLIVSMFSGNSKAHEITGDVLRTGERNIGEMEELFELRSHIEQGRYTDALVLLGEMEEMSKDDKINKIASLLEILLLHLIKQPAEKRSTRSWEASIHNAVRQIARTDKRRRVGGHYLSEQELFGAIEDGWDSALTSASLEAFEGTLSESELAQKVNEEQIKKDALQLISEAQ